MPAVKANAYGHGAVIIAKELNRLGITAFCVATVTEGIELRRGGIKGEILVLGYTHPEQFSKLLK
ncbi:alanine racemase [Oscillibacter sp. 1-3]|uniref:alanine racemase n=1 Tax=Oscillibacter sp. 1-3 TaxID=1235797 RepID=UPI00033A470C|nr:alanine racemase [Oscillibacter sp. 1-3]EOS64522.1 alanine racemase [Oscillibacter sp. 1-3]